LDHREVAHTVRDEVDLLAWVQRIQGQTAAPEGRLYEVSDGITTLQQVAAIRGAVIALLSAFSKGHWVDHVVNESDLRQRQQRS
jgi:DNA-binding FrmR family transcriptional regulator